MSKSRDYKQEYANRSYGSKMAGWYKSDDKRMGRNNDLTVQDVELLINLPCYYCGTEKAGGIDRKNSSEGHIKNNSIPSCYKCNMILGTLDFESKLILSKGLRELREKGLLEKFEPPKGKQFKAKGDKS